MSRIIKIDVVRSELSRIASQDDRADIFSPTMQACWSFARISVIGKLRMQASDYDELIKSLRQIPTGAGEAFFRNFVSRESSGFQSNGQLKANRDVIQILERRRLKIV